MEQWPGDTGTGPNLNQVPVTKAAALAHGLMLKETLLDAEDADEPPSLIWCLWAEFRFRLRGWKGLGRKLKAHLSLMPGKQSSFRMSKQHPQGGGSS